MSFTISCDFDGTITNVDVIDCILYEIIGKSETDSINNKITKNIIDIRSYLDKLTNISDAQLVDLLNIVIPKYNIVVDPTFLNFVSWCNSKSIKLVILSHGIKTIIKHFIDLDEDCIISHDLVDGKVIYNENIIPKCKYIETITNSIIHIGDGNSDFSMIGHSDILFTKQSSSLEQKCINENIQHYAFTDFEDIIEFLEITYGTIY